MERLSVDTGLAQLDQLEKKDKGNDIMSLFGSQVEMGDRSVERSNDARFPLPLRTVLRRPPAESASLGEMDKQSDNFIL